MPEQSNDYRVVVFGAGGVGKSSLVLRFVKGTFRESYIPTIEDTYRQVISSNKTICTLQITDTTGSHQFPAMQRLSISKGHAFILVYSVSSRQSLEELKPIWQTIKEIKGTELPNIPVMLAGNKCDESPEIREVSASEGQGQASAWGISFMETSAKTNHNVTQLFQELLNMEKNRNVSLQVDGKGKKKKDKATKDGGEASASGREKCLVISSWNLIPKNTKDAVTQLEEALTRLNNKDLTMNKASKLYGIPKSTLNNKLNNKVPWQRKMGPSTELTLDEEKALADWILAKAKLGFPMHPEEVFDTVETFLKQNQRDNKFKNDRPGKKWLELFLRRHPELKLTN